MWWVCGACSTPNLCASVTCIRGKKEESDVSTSGHARVDPIDLARRERTSETHADDEVQCALEAEEASLCAVVVLSAAVPALDRVLVPLGVGSVPANRLAQLDLETGAEQPDRALRVCCAPRCAQCGDGRVLAEGWAGAISVRRRVGRGRRGRGRRGADEGRGRQCWSSCLCAPATGEQAVYERTSQDLGMKREEETRTTDLAKVAHAALEPRSTACCSLTVACCGLCAIKSIWRGKVSE